MLERYALEILDVDVGDVPWVRLSQEEEGEGEAMRRRPWCWQCVYPSRVIEPEDNVGGDVGSHGNGEVKLGGYRTSTRARTRVWRCLGGME